MKKLLLSCDQVFEVLTRGPFPSGDASDEAVEGHLRACHECRRMAEALRPAVALMHEAIGSDQARELPAYQGALPAIERLDAEPAGRGKPRGRQQTLDCAKVVNALRLLAASVLVAALGLLLYSLAMAPGSREPMSGYDGGMPKRDFAAILPDEQGLITLASLKLPAACLPVAYQPLSAEHAAALVAAMADGRLDALHCCTECHAAGKPQPKSMTLVATTQQNCQACHRG
jgi:hypothetical protein